MLADRIDLRPHLPRRCLDSPDANPGEPRRVVAGRDGPRCRRGVELGEDSHVLGRTAELVRDDLGADRAVTLALRGRPEPHGDPTQRVDRDRGAFRVPRLRQRRRSLDRRLRKRDVAHVRDRRLDDARETDADEPPLGPRRLRRRAKLVPARRARAPGRDRRRSRPSRRARPRACDRASRPPERGFAAQARPDRAPVAGRRSPSSARARSRAAARRSRD